MSIGQDFGYNHANAILLLGNKDDDIYIMKEVYCFEKDTSEIIPLADKAGMPKDREMWCDSAKLPAWHLTLLIAGNSLEPKLPKSNNV